MIVVDVIMALLGLLSVLGLIVCTVALRNRVEYRARVEEIRLEIEQAGLEARELWKDGDPAFHRAYARVETLNAEKLFLEDLLMSSWF